MKTVAIDDEAHKRLKMMCVKYSLPMSFVLSGIIFSLVDSEGNVLDAELEEVLKVMHNESVKHPEAFAKYKNNK